MCDGIDRRVVVRLDDDWSFWVFGVQAFDIGSHGFESHVPRSDDDSVTASDTDYDALLIRVNVRWFVVFWLIDIYANFLNERCGDDEEDQHDEHHVQHRREIDLLVAILFLTTTPSSHDLPSLAMW